MVVASVARGFGLGRLAYSQPFRPSNCECIVTSGVNRWEEWRKCAGNTREGVGRHNRGFALAVIGIVAWLRSTPPPVASLHVLCHVELDVL